jgi:polysaccharide pyruvyl transferase WcaK-like protein
LTSRPTPSARAAFLYGYYGRRNLGDDLLLVSAIAKLRAARPDARIRVFTHSEDPAIATVGAEAAPLGRLLADPARSRAARLRAYLAELRRSFAGCDILVMGGGTILQDKGSLASLAVVVLTLGVARRCGLRTVALGIGVSRPTRRPGRWLIRMALRLLDRVAVRDKASLAVCRDLGAGPKTRLTADLVYALREPLTAARNALPPASAGRTRTIALSVQPSFVDGETPAAAAARAGLRGLIEAFIRRGERCVLLILERADPASPGHRDDGECWNRIAGDLLRSHPDQVVLRELLPSVEAIAAAYGEFEVHCGMRYHAHLIAAVLGMPFVGLAFDDKIAAICRQFEQPCFVAGEASVDEVAAAVAAGALPAQQALDRLCEGESHNLDVLLGLAERERPSGPKP